MSSDPAFGNRDSEQRLTWKTNDQGVSVIEGDREVLFYQRADKSRDGTHTRANYVHPLYDLDGNVLTEDFPDDHRHHRGIFWAWHQLRIDGKSIGDGWITNRFAWDVRELDVHKGEDGSVIITAVVDWKSHDWQNATQAMVTEHMSIRVYERDGDRRDIDFAIKLRANQPSTFIGGSDDTKGYGGFSVRLKLSDDIRFLSQNGPQTPQTDATAGSPWMSMVGRQGQTESSGLSVLTHPKSVGYPQPWILRSSRSMQNPVWPGRHGVLLPHDRWTPLSYRLVIHRGEADHQTVDRWQREYVFGKPDARRRIPTD